MNQHRRRKISGREHGGKVPKMRADLIPAGRILRVVGFGFDGSPVGVQPEMVCRFLVGESHHFIAALRYPPHDVRLGSRALARSAPGRSTCL